MQKIKFSDAMWLALNNIGIHELTPIQMKAIPVLLQEQNIMMQAPTGTGKTYAFALPILEKIDVTLMKTQAVIMAPTRELAHQIATVIKEVVIQYNPRITFELAIGGKDRERLLQNLALKQPHIIIGTPGRCEDIFVKESLVDTKYIKFAVLDETDMMFENGFLESVDAVFETIRNNQVCYAVCSATISQEIQQFIKKYIKNIQLIEIKKTDDFKNKVEYLFWDITGKNRLESLQKVMDYYNPYLALVFANTKKEVVEIYEHLVGKGYRIGILHGDMKTRERAQMLKRIHQLDFQYVICSDMAARGIDIDGVSHIINYNLPPMNALQFFHHRAGRTGRSKYEGTVFSLYERSELIKIQKLVKQDIIFDTVKFSKGEFVKQGTVQSERITKTFDDELIALSKRAKAGVNKKKKVKPGYKRKIRRAVESSVQQEKRRRKKVAEKAAKKNKRG